ncbi:membrane protein [Streptomyces phage EhyElimayoE]|nr:membrane protein [Streptomyces phage EhyElimayoE]
MIPDWYDAFFRDERMREIDPFGYGMGLALGYVIIPATLLALLTVLACCAARARRR